MEDKKAFEFLYKKAIQNNHKELANHIKRIGPLKIKLSKMSFVDHLSKIVVGQQLSVKSAAAIWARTEILLKANVIPTDIIFPNSMTGFKSPVINDKKATQVVRAAKKQGINI